MKEEIRKYFERELSYLRQMGGVFAARYPKVASRLELEPDGSIDPHVERLIEAVAFLNARTRKKLDDELPEITDSLLGILYPHYVAPVPSMALVQFVADPGQGQITAGYEIPRHATVTQKQPVRGVRCRFRTVFPVSLWPIEITGVELEDPPKVSPIGSARNFAARTLLRIRLRAIAGTTFRTLRIPSLRFHLAGEGAVAMGLYELLAAGTCRVEIHPPRARSTDTATPKMLPDGTVRPAGFDRDEIALPYPQRSFRGYALLQEYFSFPQKFLFVDIDGPGDVGSTGIQDELEIRIFCDRVARFDQAVQLENIKLGCAPVINLFEKIAEPIWVDHAKDQYLVVPDVHAPWAHEVYSVDSVVSIVQERGEVRTYEPFYGFRHGFAAPGPQFYWNVTREQAIDDATDVYLTMLDRKFSSSSPPVETITPYLTCTNRDLPSLLPFTGGLGEDLDSEDVAPFVKILCLGKPTQSRRPPIGGGMQWRLVSHLALNYLSIVEQGKEALQGILELYDFTDSAVTRRQIAGILNISSRRVLRNVNGQFCRGLCTTLELEEQGFVGQGMYLFAAVLEVFLGLYTSINSFSELTVRVKGREEPLRKWKPRAGEQVLL